MVDFQGLSAVYVPGDFAAEKRKESVPSSAPAAASTLPTQDSIQFLVRNAAANSSPAVSTPTASNALHATVEPVTPPESALLQARYTTVSQNVSNQMERIIGLLGSYFWGQRKNTPAEKELHQRGLNDFFSLDFLGERKVEPTHHSDSGDNPE